ncbi:MAG: hypothetical protein GWO20_16265 [Candidatus Korarchaeota archaeon]|nr:hypothetical protein [Candidatus Korarchaeota archaeon]NIU84966.1 hypothetical protein [Candidatus Thorarchaeota archaeon]NIW14989.1 hypothetical protein [Candidatus Thorarchaeota archaeon]NIW52999.1 hypothetical protein [Candidatus Korarchaeota archaeon]
MSGKQNQQTWKILLSPLLLYLLLSSIIAGFSSSLTVLVFTLFFVLLPLLPCLGVLKIVVPFIPVVYRWIQKCLPFIKGELYLTEDINSTWEGGGKNSTNVLKNTLTLFFALFGLEVWIVKEVVGGKMLSHAPTVNVLGILLILVVLPPLFYLIWGLESIRIISYHADPLNAHNLGGSFKRTILTFSGGSLLLFLARLLSTASISEAAFVFKHIFMFLFVYFPAMYLLTAFYFLYFQDRYIPNLYEQLQQKFQCKRIHLTPIEK